MKKLFLFVALYLSGCSSHSEDVLVIAKTNSYHRDWCARVNMAKTKEMPVKEAIFLHFDPCPLCIK